MYSPKIRVGQRAFKEFLRLYAKYMSISGLGDRSFSMGTGAKAPRFEGVVISSPYLAGPKIPQNIQT